MKTLEQHNKERIELHKIQHDNSPRKNGIACPNCGEELFDSDPMIVLTSCPPQKNIHCKNCNFRGCRIQ